LSGAARIAPVCKSIWVDASPQHAFEVFTARLDRWWPKSHTLGSSPPSESIIEPFVGGRWYTTHDDGTIAVVGHVLVFQPGERFVFTWEIGADWKPDARAAFTSEVEVRFLAASGGGTRVELEHRNFERMGVGAGEKMHDDVERGWSTLLDLYARSANARENS
jgi:uncharacterized protein YndB with AHSA1/START domain